MAEYLTLTDVSKKLGISRQAVFEYIKKGRLNCDMINNRFFISNSDFLDFVKKNNILSAGQITSDYVSFRDIRDFIFKRLGYKVPASTLYRYVRSSKVNVYRVGNKKYIKLKDLGKLLDHVRDIRSKFL